MSLAVDPFLDRAAWWTALGLPDLSALSRDITEDRFAQTLRCLVNVHHAVYATLPPAVYILAVNENVKATAGTPQETWVLLVSNKEKGAAGGLRELSPHVEWEAQALEKSQAWNTDPAMALTGGAVDWVANYAPMGPSPSQPLGPSSVREWLKALEEGMPSDLWARWTAVASKEALERHVPPARSSQGPRL